MKFEVTRTSDLFNKEKPCKDAKREIIKRINHKDLQFEDNAWIIEIETFEDVLKLTEESVWKSVVIKMNTDLCQVYPEIEIYDDWRE